MGRPALALDVPYRLIQAVRLVHAAMESDVEIRVPADETSTFEYLQGFFPLRFGVGIEGVPLVPAVVAHDELPSTGIGELRRPLIFPHAIVERCRSRWPRRRAVRFSFCGLLNEARRALLEAWAGAQLPEGTRDPSTASLAHRTTSRFGRRVDLEIWASRRGRSFPVKAWDEEYFDVLARSEFVLCPNGDFVWTYRFFEAILCGAMPVIQDDCDAFAGFTYHLMSEDPQGLRWDAAIAEQNRALAVERLTVPSPDLTAALAACF